MSEKKPAGKKSLSKAPIRKWRQRRDRHKGQCKKKVHVSIDAHICLIGRNTGNLSAFLNEAAKSFVSSKHFMDYIKKWSEEESDYYHS